jgi:hypothetical protein
MWILNKTTVETSVLHGPYTFSSYFFMQQNVQ